MKKVLILLVTATLTLPAFGQVHKDFIEKYLPGKKARKANAGFTLPQQSFKNNPGNGGAWATEEITQRLDSFVMFLSDESRFQKQSFTYNENGDVLVADYAYFIDSTNSWWVTEYDEFTYNQEGKLISEMYYNWDDDSARNLPYYQINYSYSPDGLLNEAIIQRPDSGVWVNNHKLLYQYDAQSQLTEIINYYMSADWELSDKSAFSYDSTGNLSAYTYYFRNMNSWQTGYMNTYSYTNSGKLHEITQYNWDYDSSKLVFDRKDILSYNPNDYMTEFTSYSWDDSLQGWITDDAEIRVYDQNNNPVEIIYKDWNQDSSRWENQERNTLVYDPSVSGDQLIIPFDDEESVDLFRNGKITRIGYFEWSSGDSTWENYFDLEVYYSDVTASVGIEKLPAISGLNIFPNPATDRVYISMENTTGPAKITLLDIQGREISSQIVQTEGYTEVSSLPRGMYLMRVETQNQGSFTKKIVLE